MKKILPLVFCLLAACSSTPENPEMASYEVNDPLEGFNRAVFKFNDVADKYVLKPIAKGYQFITPQFVDDGISNFFDNLTELNTILNSLLQGKLDNAGNSTGRFLVNSTFGLLGFFDVATKVNIEVDKEDFGQTFARWGAGSGPYIVLPFLGPSTVRDGLGRIPDAYTNLVSEVDHIPTRNALRVVDIIDTRADLLDAEELISGDRYIFIRDFYLQNREYLINDGEVEDDFGDEDF